MVWLSRWWPAVSVAALLSVSHWWSFHHGVTVTDSAWSAKWSDRDAADATARADAELAQRNEEQRRADWAAGVQRDATQALENARTDAAGSAADANRLRGELAKLQARLSETGASPAAPASSTSTTRAAMVLSELLDSCVGQRQELASAFDRSRIAGLACERSYDGLIQSHANTTNPSR